MHRSTLLLPVIFLVGCGGPAPVTPTAPTAPTAPTGPAPAVPREPAALKALPPGAHEETAEIPGIGPVLYTIKVPEGYDGKTPTPLVLLLHYGYDGPKPNPYTGGDLIEAFEPGLAGLGAILLAPDVLGGDWTDPENEAAAVQLTLGVMKAYAVDASKVVVAGYSMGGEGAWYLGSKYQDLFTGVIPVAAPVVDDASAWKVPIYVIHSKKDEAVPFQAAKDHADALRAKGAKLKFQAVEDLTHFQTGQYAPHLKAAVDWLKSEWATPAR